jgi:hypothetical protein
MTETTSTSADVERVHEMWTWAGARLDRAGKLQFCWVDPDGHELCFGKAKLAGSAIGATYRAEIVRKPDGGVSLYGAPEFVRRADYEDERRLQWTAADKIARTVQARKRAEANAAKQNALDEALAPVVAIAATLRTNADKDALAAYVLRSIRTAWA